MFAFRNLHSPEIFPACVIGVLLSMGTLIAMWAALGEANVAVRLTVLAIAATGAELALQWMSGYWARQFVPRIYGLVLVANSLGQLWIAWCALTVVFVGAMLLAFRSSGYRLTRSQQDVTATAAP